MLCGASFPAERSTDSEGTAYSMFVLYFVPFRRGLAGIFIIMTKLLLWLARPSAGRWTAKERTMYSWLIMNFQPSSTAWTYHAPKPSTLPCPIEIFFEPCSLHPYNIEFSCPADSEKSSHFFQSRRKFTSIMSSGQLQRLVMWCKLPCGTVDR